MTPLSRFANAVSAKSRKLFLPRSHFAPSFGVTPVEFMEKLQESSGQPTVKIW